MLSHALAGLVAARRCVLQQFRRNIGITAVVTQKAAALDPIQQMFVQKVREYGQKSKATGGKFVDATPELENDLKSELEKLDKVYNVAGKDMTQFPTFSFSDPDLEPVGVNIEVKEVAEEAKAPTEEPVAEKEIRHYFDI